MNYSFEEAMQRLDFIAKELALPSLKLEDGINLYSEGVKLIAFCNEKLGEVDKLINDINVDIIDE